MMYIYTSKQNRGLQLVKLSKSNKGIKIGRKNVKPPLFANDTNVFLKILENQPRKQ